MYKLNISVKLLYIMGAAIFKILFDILSIPVAFAIFTPLSNLTEYSGGVYSFKIKARISFSQELLRTNVNFIGRNL